MRGDIWQQAPAPAPALALADVADRPLRIALFTVAKRWFSPGGCVSSEAGWQAATGRRTEGAVPRTGRARESF